MYAFHLWCWSALRLTRPTCCWVTIKFKGDIDCEKAKSCCAFAIYHSYIFCFEKHVFNIGFQYRLANACCVHGSKLAQVDLKMPLCWLKLASRCPKWLSIAKLHQFLAKNCSFWNALDLQNIEKNIGFIGPFASCTFLFLLMLFEPLSWLKLAPSWLKLAKLSKFEPKLSQVGSKLAQVGSKLGPSWLHVGSSWAHVGAKLAPS